jgi:hypothetical protein
MKFQRILGPAGLALALGALAAEGNEMDSKTSMKIAQKAQADQGWKAEDVRVDEVESIRRGSCTFYEAGHSKRPLPYVLNYALLPDGQVVGLKESDAVSRILDACGGKDAPAGWWAEIVTRFHGSLGSGVVLHEENQEPPIIRKMKEAGKSFAAPALSAEGKTRILTFYVLDPESYILYHVTATRSADGAVEVSKSEVL